MWNTNICWDLSADSIKRAPFLGALLLFIFTKKLLLNKSLRMVFIIAVCDC